MEDAMHVVTAAEMQEMDRQTIEEFGIPGRVLMECAGRGATRTFIEKVFKTGSGPIGIMAGRGNNGGDGFVIARYLFQRDFDVKVFLLSDQKSVKGDAAANLSLLRALKVPVIEIPDPKRFAEVRNELRHINYWIDAVLGTGLNSDVKGYFRQVLEFINSRQRPVLAVDIPSGLNADTGQPCGVCINATVTTTFAFPKIGHVVYPGVRHCGTVDVVDIGVPPFIADQTGIQQQLVSARKVQSIVGLRSPEAHKGKTGHLMVVAGATGKTGAAAMTANAALRIGAGLVTLSIPQQLNAIVESQLLEVMTVPLPDQGTGLILEEAFDAIVAHSAGKQALVVGPGIGTASHTRNIVHRIIKELDMPLVIDADGINNLAGHASMLRNRTAATVLTPHPGEMARLTGLSTKQIQQDRVAVARNFAIDHGACVVLKGARTISANPDGTVWINPTGNPGMASGGMGDVLTGMIGGLMAQGREAADAAICGVFLHGLAADILAKEGPWGYLATDVITMLPQAMGRIINNTTPEPLQGDI
jgi:NAD(P)H-hydrate epimerase